MQSATASDAGGSRGKPGDPLKLESWPHLLPACLLATFLTQFFTLYETRALSTLVDLDEGAS